MVMEEPKLLRKDDENDGRGARGARIVYRCSREEDIGIQR